MSKTKDENITTKHLKLGDIIKIESPDNSDLNEKIFLINYITKEQINIISSDFEISLRVDENKLADKTIESIELLSRSDKEGYVQQNNLVVNTWLDIYFGGDLPETITGKITNIENDMIEITLYPDVEKIIYIDFGYSGLPVELNIEKIEIRESPKKIEDIELPDDPIPLEEDLMDQFIDEEEVVLPGEALTNLNNFVLGEELDDILQPSKVKSKEKRFGVEIQERDMIDDMISKLEEKERTDRNINKIQKIVESFKILRKNNSVFDSNGNVESILKKGAKHKPLVNEIISMSKKIDYFMPVINLGKKIDDENKIEDRHDAYSEKLQTILNRMDSAYDVFANNETSSSENNYNDMISELNDSLNPYFKIEDENTFCVESKKEIECLVSNNDDLTSSSIVYKKLDDSKYNIVRTNGKFFIKKLQEDVFKDEQKMLLKENKSGDEVCIKSFLFFPKMVFENYVNSSSENLLSKLDKFYNFSNKYSLLLNKSTKINEIVISELGKKVDFDKDSINHLILSDNINITNSLQNELLLQYLHTIIPKTLDFIEIFQKELEDKTSITAILQYLESFFIKHEDLTFTQWDKITDILDNNRKLYKKRFEKIHDKFYDYRTKIKNSPSDKYGYKVLKNKYLSNYHFKYSNLNDILYTESEILSDSISKDYSNALILSLVNVDLMSEENNNQLVEYFNKKYNNPDKKEKNECDSTVLIAKKYRKLKELDGDNDKEIYFDAEFDDTVYELLDVYEKEKTNLSPMEFKSFLRGKLISINGIDDDNADYIVESLINSKKKVLDGQYAILETIPDENDDIDKMYYNYYKREGNSWVFDNMITDKNKFKLLLQDSCDFKNKCVEDEGIMIKDFSRQMSNNECISVKEHLKTIKRKILKKMIVEFEHTYSYSMEQMQKLIRFEDEKSLSYLSDKIKIKTNENLKYNNFLYYQLGLNLIDNIDKPTSPYGKLLDLILKKEDLYDKSNYILKFCNKFTRNSINEEDPNWKYCKESGVKLVPVFRYELAHEYIKDTSFYKENYINALNRIRKEQGTLSSDGDKYISKFGGWKIIDVEDFAGEEYDPSSGYRVTKESLDNDDDIEIEFDDEDIINEVSNMLENKKDIFEFKQLYSNENSKKIYEIIVIIINELGVSLNQETINFIIKYVNKSFEIYFYNETLNELSKNKVILILTISSILLGIQLKVNNVTATKSVKSCKTSFVGFPLFPDHGIEGVEYIACVSYSLRTKKSSLFKLFSKVKENNIVDAIIEYTNNYLLVLPEVQKMILEIKNKPSEDIKETVNFKKWNDFLPPVVSYTVKSENNVSTELVNEIFYQMRKGDCKFLYNMNVIRGKIIKTSFALLYDIQKIVSNKKLILENKRGEYFTENACCNDENVMSPLEYFNNIDNSILAYHDILINLSDLKINVNTILKSNTLLLELNKRSLNVKLQNEMSISEANIYQTIIHYCKIGDKNNTKRPSLNNVCKDLEIEFNIKDTIVEKIEKLKNSGINFNLKNLNELMGIINNENKTKVNISTTEISKSQKLRLILEDEMLLRNDVINNKLYEIMDNYNAHLDKNTEEANVELQTYLFDENTLIQDEIIEFLDSNITFSTRDNTNIKKFFNKIISFNNNQVDEEIVNDDYYHKNIEYLKNISYEVGSLFPSIIENQNDLSKYKFPSSWKGMSDTHDKRVKKIIKDYYSKFEFLFANEQYKKFIFLFKEDTKKFIEILDVIPTYNTIENENIKIQPLLNYKTTLYLFKHIYLKINKIILDYCSSFQVNLEIEDRNNFKRDVGMYLFKCYSKNIENVNLFDMNYEYLMNKVKSKQEQEKNEITEELANMKKPEKEVELFKKKYKNDGRWAMGAKKELIKYKGSAYDRETSEIGDMNMHLMSEINEYEDLSNLNEDYTDGMDVIGFSEMEE